MENEIEDKILADVNGAPKKRIAKLAEVAGSLVELTTRMTKLEEMVAALTTKLAASDTVAPRSLPPAAEASLTQMPVPSEYRQIVNTVLNQSFGVEVVPMENVPAFEFAVIVPKVYSNAGKTYLETYGIDRRPRVISYAEGANGVREWVEKVYSNFNQDTRTRITLERSTVNT